MNKRDAYSIISSISSLSKGFPPVNTTSIVPNSFKISRPFFICSVDNQIKGFMPFPVWNKGDFKDSLESLLNNGHSLIQEINKRI